MLTDILKGIKSKRIASKKLNSSRKQKRIDKFVFSQYAGDLDTDVRGEPGWLLLTFTGKKPSYSKIQGVEWFRGLLIQTL